MTKDIKESEISQEQERDLKQFEILQERGKVQEEFLPVSRRELKELIDILNTKFSVMADNFDTIKKTIKEMQQNKK